jgi:hypothetical protein
LKIADIRELSSAEIYLKIKIGTHSSEQPLTGKDLMIFDTSSDVDG